MALYAEDIKGLNPIGSDQVQEEIYFYGSRLLSMRSGAVYSRLDGHFLTLYGSNGVCNFYDKQGSLYAHFPSTNLFTKITKANCISETRNFDGFALGNQFH